MSKGYVYILTNPYFRKGIVKIGMSWEGLTLLIKRIDKVVER